MRKVLMNNHIPESSYTTNGSYGRNFIHTYSNTSTEINHLSSFDVSSNNFTNTYDANGNLTKEGTTRYLVWGHNDKPVIFYNRVGTSTPTVFTHYFYNAAGDRVKKLTRKGQKLEVTVYVDGGIFELTYTKPTGGSIDVNLYYNTLYLKDGNSAIVSIQVGSNTPDLTPPIKYHIEDHLGNCTVQLNDNGNLVRREEFYPFGETAFGSYAFKRYRFNGKEKDEESGLYNYGQRYYAPWLCRFVSVDPIAESYPQLSSYNYAGNKPISKVDQRAFKRLIERIHHQLILRFKLPRYGMQCSGKLFIHKIPCTLQSALFTYFWFKRNIMTSVVLKSKSKENILLLVQLAQKVGG